MVRKTYLFTVLDVNSTLYSGPEFLLPVHFQEISSVAEMQNLIYQSFFDPPLYSGGYIFDKMDTSTNEFQWTIVFNKTVSNGLDVPFLMNIMSNAIARSFSTPFTVELQGIKAFPSVPFTIETSDLVITMYVDHGSTFVLIFL